MRWVQTIFIVICMLHWVFFKMMTMFHGKWYFCNIYQILVLCSFIISICHTYKMLQISLDIYSQGFASRKVQFVFLLFSDQAFKSEWLIGFFLRNEPRKLFWGTCMLATISGSWILQSWIPSRFRFIRLQLLS